MRTWEDGIDTSPEKTCGVCGITAPENWEGWAPWAPRCCKKCVQERPVLAPDAELPRRLDVARTEVLFQGHLRDVFGDRHAEFSAHLRGRLRELWRRALETSMPTVREMTAREEEQLLSKNPVVFAHQAAGAMRQAIKTVENSSGSYPPTTADAGCGPSFGRDTRLPPCPHCGGGGGGLDGFRCLHCHGSGNG